MSEIERTVKGHYSSGGLLNRLQQVAEFVGIDWDSLTPADLAPIDQFHIRGREATLEMISMSGFSNSQLILDVGCGIGGAARTLAAETGCDVHGIDLTDEFIEAAKEITRKTGQNAKVEFDSCSALQLPFVDARFDGAWMQHVNMNISDKSSLFKEIARVVKPGGTFVFHEILADQHNTPYFPAPWATNPDESVLITESEFKTHLTEAGFAVADWVDSTEESAAWFENMFEKAAKGEASKLNLSVLMGDSFPEMARNVHRSLKEGRIKVVMAACNHGWL